MCFDHLSSFPFLVFVPSPPPRDAYAQRDGGPSKEHNPGSNEHEQMIRDTEQARMVANEQYEGSQNPQELLDQYNESCEIIQDRILHHKVGYWSCKKAQPAWHLLTVH